MRPAPIFSTALLAVAGIALTAPSAEAQRVVRTLNETFDAAGHEAVVVDMSAGEVRVEGAAVSTIAAEIRVHCPRGRDIDRCRDRAEDVELSSRQRRGKLFVDVDGPGLWRSRDAHIEIVLIVPAAMAVEVDLGAGEINIVDVGGRVTVELGAGEAKLTGVRGDVDVDVGAGEVVVTMNEDEVRSVRLDNGIGETSLQHRGGNRTRGGIMAGTDVRWNDGPGTRRVEVDLNVGEISVRLQ